MLSNSEHRPEPPPSPREPDEECIKAFGRAVDALRREVEAEIGEEDLAHLKGVRAASTTLEVFGRLLIHTSLEPVSFGAGVLALSAHKVLELMEIGHTALHGAFDRVEGAETFRSTDHRWKAPIDEESWRTSHNVRHHQYTNVAYRDPDLDFGGLRLSQHIRRRLIHRLQPFSNLVTWLGFSNAMNLHATGVLEVYVPSGAERVLEDRSWRSVWAAHARFLKKTLRYHGREYVVFPALAGPFFLKTLAGNFLSEVVRDVYAGAVIYCGHVGTTEYPEGAQAKGRAHFYAMQVEGAADFEVPLLVSILCGGLDRQIEHHVFPKLPPNRLRKIAPRLRAICETHGIRYRTAPWPDRLRSVLSTLSSLGGARAADAVA